MRGSINDSTSPSSTNPVRPTSSKQATKSQPLSSMSHQSTSHDNKSRSVYQKQHSSKMANTSTSHQQSQINHKQVNHQNNTVQQQIQMNQEGEYIPLPIQTFLWRNTNPFVKPREKRESGNVIEQKDSCKLFERIIITNNVWGQSPSLTDAIASIDRWRLIKVSFPFVLQSTANQLNNKFIRDYTLNKMGSNESKMLYCLQWILMNAAEECADSENEAKNNALAALGGACALLKPLGAHAGVANSSNSGSTSVSPAGGATGSNLAAGCLTGVAAVAAGIAVGQALVSQGSTSSTSTNLVGDCNAHQSTSGAQTITDSQQHPKALSPTSPQSYSMAASSNATAINSPPTTSSSNSAQSNLITAINQSIIKPATSTAVAVAMPTTIKQQHVAQVEGKVLASTTHSGQTRIESTNESTTVSAELASGANNNKTLQTQITIASSSSVSPLGPSTPTKPFGLAISPQQSQHPATSNVMTGLALQSAPATTTVTSTTINNYRYLLPNSSIQMFVYYFAPLMEPLEMSDFLKTNQRLEIGVALWEPLFNHELPNVQCLNAPVLLQHQYQLQYQQSCNGKPATTNQQQQQQIHQDTFLSQPKSHYHGQESVVTTNDARRRSSAAVGPSSHDQNDSQHQIHQSQHQQSQFGDVFIGGPNNSSGPAQQSDLSKQSTSQLASQQSGTKRQGAVSACSSGITASIGTADLTSKVPSGEMLRGRDGIDGLSISESVGIVNYATYLDVAVLRCLFMNNWQESGVFWALRYTNKRIDQFDYSDANLCLMPSKPKSKSLPNLYAACLQFLRLNQKTCEQLIGANSQWDSGVTGGQLGYNPTGEDLMRDYLKFEAENNQTNSSDLNNSDFTLSNNKKIEKPSALSSISKYANECELLSKPLSHTIQTNRSSRRSSSAEDLTTKQISDLASNKSISTRQSSRQTRVSSTKNLDKVALTLDEQPVITISGDQTNIKLSSKKSTLDQQLHEQVASQCNLNITNLDGDDDEPDLEEDEDAICSIAKTEHQFLIQSLYLKSLRRLDKITRSFSVPENMNYSSTASNGLNEQQLNSNNHRLHHYDQSKETPESNAASNYIDGKGRIDPIVILKLAHSITQRESVCSLRVCDELLNLVYKLIDIGILNDNFHYNMARDGKLEHNLADLLPTREQDYTMVIDIERDEQQNLASETMKTTKLNQQFVRRQIQDAKQKTKEVFKMLIDITLYLYHHSGCPNRCGLDSIMDQLQHAVQNHKMRFISATLKQASSQAASNQNILAEDQMLERLFKPKLRKMLVTLYTHDQAYFIKYVNSIIQSRTLQEIVDILHSILGFCRSEYILSLTQLTASDSQAGKTNQSQQDLLRPKQTPCQTTESQQQPQKPHHHQQSTVQFCNILDSPQSHGNDSMARMTASAAAAIAASGPSGSSSGPLVEAEILNSVFKLLVTRMSDVNKKLKLQEHTSLYCDIRRLISFVRDNYNGTFRRILLSSLIDCTKIMNEQQREEEKQNLFQRKQQFIAATSAQRYRAKDGLTTAYGAGTPSDDESSGVMTSATKKYHHYKQQHQLDHQSMMGRSSPIIPGDSSSHHQSPVNVSSVGAMGSSYLINQVDQSNQHRTSQGSDRLYGQYQKFNHQTHEQHQREQTSGILSLSKAKKKLEQVFGGKTTTATTGSRSSMTFAEYRNLKATSINSNINDEALSSSNLMLKSMGQGNANMASSLADGSCVIDDPSRRTSLIGNQSVASIQHHDSITTAANIRSSQNLNNLNQLGASSTQAGAPGASLTDWSSPATVNPNSNLPIIPGPYSLLGSLQAGGNLMSRRLFEAMHNGMTNFSFLMESSPPGEFLDPALLAALLDLKSPIAIRAAIFLECSNLVHRCNRGQWPSWMKMNMTTSHHHHHHHQHSIHRPSSVGLGGLSQSQVPGAGGSSNCMGASSSSSSKFRKSSSIQRNVRNNTLMYRAAGKAFYSWAEAIGVRLEEMLLSELDKNQVLADDVLPEQDDAKEEEELENYQANKQRSCSISETAPPVSHNTGLASGDIDFFKPTIGNSTSPFALKMAACQLLFEVTTFLRETYRYLPPTIASHQVVGSKLGDKMTSIYDVSRAVTANRRWSMALSSLGFGQLPATLNALSTSPGPTTQQVNALISANNNNAPGQHLKNPAGSTTTSSIPEHPSERRISFILHESNNENDNSNSIHESCSSEQQITTSETNTSGQLQPQSLLAPVVTTNDQQQEAIRKMTGRNLSQSSASNAVVVAAATCLLRSSGMIDSQAHRRKSIKLKKRDDKDTVNNSSSSSIGPPVTGKKITKFAPTDGGVDEDGVCDNNSMMGPDGLRRTDSMRSRRRVSGISEKTDVSEPKLMLGGDSSKIASSNLNTSVNQHHHQQDLSGDENGSLGNNSCDDVYGQESMDRFEQDQSRIMSNMPWFKAISLINSNIDCECSHFPNCRPQCYKLHQNMCKRLILSVQTIYSSGNGDDEANLTAIFEAKLAALLSQHATTTPQGENNQPKSTFYNNEQFTRAGSDCSANTLNEDLHATNNNIKTSSNQHHYNKKSSLEHKKQANDLGTPKNHGYKHQKQFSAAAPINLQTPTHSCSRQLDPNQASLLETLRALNLYRSNQSSASKKQQHQQADELPILRYMRINVKNFLHCPMSAFLKGAVILPRESFVEMIKFSWNLLLEDDQQLSRTAAVCFIISSIKCPPEATELLMNELASSDASKKIAAINKFHVVWDARYQCWPRLEDGAFVHFKMAPPSIEFTLPSPKIAQESKPVVDPPWMPRKTSNVEEVTIGQDQTVQRSFVTATKTRRKQQIEIVNRALKEKHDKLRQGRESYHITSVPVTLYAAYEPTLGANQPGSDDPDGVGGGGNSSNMDEDTQQESRALIQMKTAQALFPTCLCQAAIVLINLLDDSRVTYEGSAVYEVANKVIWSCLVEDPSLFLRYFFERLTRQNQSTIFQVLRRLIRFMPKLPPQAAFTLYNYLIGFVIYYIRSPVAISQKLIAETLSVLCFVVPSVYALFLKDLKQIFRKEQCDNALLITANVPSAKKIIVHGSDSSGIPSQFPIDESTQFYHILIDSLEFFGIKKDKQDEYFLIDVRTNQMHNLHSYVRDYYSFKRSQHPQLQLISMNPDQAFHILQSQELTNQFLEYGKVLMTHTVVKSSHMAVGRALFLHEELMKLPTFPRRALETNFSLFRGTTGHQVFSMDRMHKVCWVKAISRMFELTSGFFLQLGEIHLFLNAISGVFVLHCEEAAVSRLCLATFINAAHHFKNIFATDGFTPIMSTIVQVYSNHQNNHLLCRSIEFVCKQFYIMHRKPFLLQLFGSVALRLNTAEILQQNQTNNPISANSFYTSCTSSGHLSANQNPNSPGNPNASSSTMNPNGYDIGDPSCISPNAFFRLLQSLEKAFKDPLDILELVDAEKPLRAVDFCYQQDKEIIDILDIISLCVTVTAYASDSPRSTQMLIILETVVPLYMKYLQAATSKKAGQSMGKQAHKDELQKIQSISVCIRTLIVNCDGLTRSFSGPLPYIDFKSSSIRRNNPMSKSTGNQTTRQQGNNSSPFAPDLHTTTEFSHSGVHLDPSSHVRQNQNSSMGVGGATSTKQATIAPNTVDSGGNSGGNKTSRQTMNTEESEITRGEFIVPRDTLLNLTAEFLSLSTIRLVESAKKYVDLHQKHSSYELLDVKSHLKLAEVANSLLKFASTDPSVMACRGLTRYMNEILPNTEWRQEAIRPALIMILKRLDKTFNRIAKKNSVKRNTDWEGAKQLLKGAYLTFIKHPYIVHLPHLKSLISCCQNIILSDSLTGTSNLLSTNFFQGLTSSNQNNQLVPSPPTATGIAGITSRQVPSVGTSISQSASMQMGGGSSMHQQASMNSSNNNLLRVTSQHHASGSSLGPSNSSNQLNLQSQSQSQLQGSPIDNNSGSTNNNNQLTTPGGQQKMTNLPSFVTTVAAAALAERLAATAASSNNSITSHAFNSVTVRLIAMQLLQAGDTQTLESLIGNSMNTPEKLESVTLNLIYPMCIRVCSGSREAPKLRPCDITFILNIVLNMLAPHSSSSKSCSSNANSPKVTSDTSQFILSKITTTIGSSANATGAMGALGIIAGGGGSSGGFGLANSHSNTNANAMSNSNSANQQQFVQHQERLKIAFLGLKILCVCFENHLAGEWIRISRVIRDLTLERNQPIGSLWDFLDFVATYRFPLLVLLIPTIKCHLARKIRLQQQSAATKKSNMDSGSLGGPSGGGVISAALHEQLYNNNSSSSTGGLLNINCDSDDNDSNLASYNMQCLRLIEAKISGQATTVCRSRSFLFVSLAAELRMLKEQLVAKRRAQLDGERVSNSLHHNNSHHHHSGATAAGSGGTGAGSSPGGFNQSGAHRSSGGAMGAGPGSRANQEVSGSGSGTPANQDHFSTYHRLSAAIAMFSNQANLAKNQHQAGAPSTAPVMTSAALKASTCFAAQLAAPSVTQQVNQQQQEQQHLNMQHQTIRSPDISLEQSQNSIRLSTAKSREEARAVMNTILRRTSYPHHQPIGSPEHHAKHQSSSSKFASTINKPQSSQVDIEAGNLQVDSSSSKQTPLDSFQLNPATLMGAIPAPRPKNAGSGSVLKQLVNTIDKRNQQKDQQEQH